MMPYLFSN